MDNSTNIFLKPSSLSNKTLTLKSTYVDEGVQKDKELSIFESFKNGSQVSEAPYQEKFHIGIRPPFAKESIFNNYSKNSSKNSSTTSPLAECNPRSYTLKEAFLSLFGIEKKVRTNETDNVQNSSEEGIQDMQTGTQSGGQNFSEP